MYSVYAGNTCIYDDTSNDKSLRLIAPTLELADSAAGSFKMTVPVTNAGYNLIERLKTYITVMKDGEEMWEGRVIDESIDFWKNRTLTCEGELAYLNDSTQPPAEYHDLTVRGFLETLIQIHNSKVSEERRFTVGAVTVTDPNDSLYRYTNYEKTIECINDKLVSRLGGHLVVRKENGVRYLDYLADKLSTNTQTIEFGTNLLDYTASFDMTEYATVVVPLGERLEESPIAALEAYTTVASVNDGSIYVQNEEAVSSYGWIEKVVHFDRVTQPSNLLRKAQQYLSDLQFDNMILEVKAVDLHYMNPEIEGVKLSDQIRVISQPHGLNKVFPVMKLSIPLDQPENTLFTLGTKIQTSLTAENNKVNSEIKQRIEEMPTKQSVLDEARDNATEIMDLISNGYITITHGQNGSEELYISDTQDLTQATRWWRWNVNGLAYYNTNMGSTSPVLAMTMDGSIVADRITTGTLRADLLDAVRIKASTFIVENESDPSQQGETLETVFQRFSVSDQELSSEIGGLTQIAVKSVQVYYALGDSQTTAPSDDDNWSTTAPEWQSDKYMWQKTLTVFADDTQEHPHKVWSAATCIQGAKGESGNNGYNTAIVYLYKRSATPVTTIDWSGTLTYYFTTHSLNSIPTGWYDSIPSGDDPLYVTAATAYSNTGSDAIASTDWSAPIKMVENGTDGAPGAPGTPGTPGTPGYNSATAFLYQRSASVPAKPTVDSSYTFSNGELFSFKSDINVSDLVQGQWSYSTPDSRLTRARTKELIYVKTGTVLTYTVSAYDVFFGVLETPTSSAYVWAPGWRTASGTLTVWQDGWMTFVIRDHTNTSANVTPSAWDGTVSIDRTDWVQKIPTTDGNPCYVIQATASSTDATDSIASTEWSNPVILVEDGVNGNPGRGISRVIPEYYLSTSATSRVGGSWSTTSPTWVSGKYIWTRSHVYYDDGTESSTAELDASTVLDTQANQFGQNYTSIKQTVDSIRLSAASGGTPVGTYSGVSETSTLKKFVQQGGANGYYVSTNEGINSSLSYGKLTFNFSTTTTVTLKCISYGENNYDYGIISTIDASLTQTNTADTTNVFHSFKGESSAVPQELSMTIPNGSHFITFKYIKDSSTNSYDDVFKIKAYIGDGDPASSVIQLTGNGIQASSASIDLSGTVTFSDLAGEGSTQINGANIMTGTISADAIHVNDVYYGTDYKVLTSSIDTSTSSGNSDLRVKLGISNNSKPSDVSSTEIYGYRTVFYDDIIGQDNNAKLEIQCDAMKIVPGESGDWYLGDSYAPFRRLYLSSNPTVYLHYDSSTEELLLRVGSREYTVFQV